MKNKTVLISAILGVLLVGSIAGTVILVNQYSVEKESLSGIENELSIAQTELGTAKATLEQLEVTYNELTKPTSTELVVSGDSILESGVTMDEAYHMVEAMRAAGQSKDYLSEMVKKLGTSLEAIEKYGETIKVDQQPLTQEPSGNTGGQQSSGGSSGSGTQQPSGNTSGGQDIDGDGKIDVDAGGNIVKGGAYDKNNNGINDGVESDTVTDGSGSGVGDGDYELDTH